MNWQVWLAGGLFILTYAIIVSERIHRTTVAVAGAGILVLLGVLSQNEALKSIDFNTIGLLTGMMIIVGIMRETGVFEYMAIKTAKRALGDPMKIMLGLSLITAAASALLDNVTTVLLIVPVTFSICARLDVSPVPMLVAEIFASNIGGTATLIGDPPNIMIGSAVGLGFSDFLINLGPVVVIILGVTMGVLVWVYRASLKVDDEHRRRIEELDETQALTDNRLLLKSLLVLFLVMVGFVLHSRLHLESATIALVGAGILLLVSGADPEDVLLRVEWGTLAFFMGLFVLVGGLEKTGIIEYIARGAVNITQGNPTLTAMLVLWLSALASAFVDNIPFVATFIPLIQEMGRLGAMDTTSMWWALSLGACLGGNGTLVGASANVIVSGLAERHGHPISFVGYMKLAMPLMLLSIIICTSYLLLFFL